MRTERNYITPQSLAGEAGSKKACTPLNCTSLGKASPAHVHQLSLILRHIMPLPSRHGPQQEWHTPMRGVAFQERLLNNKSYREIENDTGIPFNTGRIKLVQQVLTRYPPPSNAVTLHYCAAREGTTERTSVHCNCRDQKNGVQPVDVPVLRQRPSAPLLVMEELIQTIHLTV